MLSPASLRVCCLAVMAPALTKADRRADCLPVVLPFCVSKTATPENRKDKINELSLAKLPTKLACISNKNKLMHRAWFRGYLRNNSEFSDKNRYSSIDLRKSLLNSKVRINADTKNKSWHGTNVTLAVADKVRLKYTMNKNNSSFRNMGLARANTSLGLHRMNRIAQLSHKDKQNPSNLLHESGESSPDLPDSTNSELETSFRIVRIVQPVQGQSTGDVSSSGDLNCDSTVSPTENVISTSDNAHSDMIPTLDNIPLSSFSESNKVTFSESNLAGTLTDSMCSLRVQNSSVASKGELTTLESSLDESLTLEPCSVPVKGIESNDTIIKEDSFVLSQSDQVIVPDVSDFKESELQNSSLDHLNCITSLPSPLCNVSVQDDVAASFEGGPLPFSVASPHSPRLSPNGSDAESCSFSSSTLSADASPLPSSLEEENEKVFITFPDSFLASASGVHKELVAPAFADVSCLTLNSDSISSEDGMHIMRKTCCPLAAKDLSSFQELLLEHEKRISAALHESQILMRKYLIEHVQQQLRTLVQHFQKKLTIPCQRQAKLNDSKSVRDLADLKAEFLQNKDVKNMSTAALVSLVRRLESNSSTANLLLHQNIPSQNSEQNKSALLDPEEYADVKSTSKVLLRKMKKLLQSADPDLTESSDEGSSDVEMDEPEETPAQKKALWKFMKERAALASRSTLLFANIRELENQLSAVVGYLQKVSSTYGDICFEEQLASESSALSTLTTESSGDASLQTPVKQSRSKGLGRPVNGYLDHSSVNSAIHIGTPTNSSEALRLEQKLNNTIATDVESCSRTRALKASKFHKRKLLVTTGLHLTNNKLAKLSTVGCVCNCQDEMLPCVLCTGRYNCIQSVDPDTLPLLDRVALLEPNFHPLLSFEKDIPLLVHFENILKKNEAKYQSVRPVSPVPSDSRRRMRLGTKPKHLTDIKSRNRKLNRYARSLLSAKYRNKKHFRKHKLVFGKWRKLQNKSSFHSRDRFRRLSVASSASSHDSPVPSPLSAYDDGSGYDIRRRRDDNQFDIDDVIIPYSNKRGRLVKFEFKDIEIPSWRPLSFENLKCVNAEEDTSEAAYIKRHEGYEIEERKIIRNGGGALCFFNTWQKRARRQHRFDSQADSSGANTPDPVLLCDQDIVFQDTNSLHANSPMSPALSPPTTPSSANVVSDDSQQALGNSRRKVGGAKRPEESSSGRGNVVDYDEISPYERRSFPLSEETVEELLAESDHNRDDTDVTASGPSCPASPVSTTSSTSTVDEEDVTDPEWRVVKRENGPEQALVLKFAKR